MHSKKFSFLFIVLVVVFQFVFFANTYSQTSLELRRLSEKRKREIEMTEELLNETRSKKNISLSTLNLLNKKIELRDSYIVTLNQEINLINKELGENENLVYSLRNDLEKIRLEYARLIYNAYKNRKNQNFLVFILTSESFNQAYKRIKYMQMYTAYKRKQMKLIEAYRKVILSKINELKIQKVQKENLVKLRENEKFQLIKEKEDQNDLIKKLKLREGELISELNEKKRAAEKLAREIELLIERERKKNNSRNKLLTLTPEEKLISAEFEKNRGRLPWPTAQGVITGHFGIQKHPVFNNLDIRNDGIYISTIPNEDARAVFDGIVTKVFSFPGSNYTVLIKHGNYFSLYNNLIRVYVKEGDNVKTKEKIGKIFTDNEKNETILHFQIWKEKERNDPEIWLSRF